MKVEDKFKCSDFSYIFCTFFLLLFCTRKML